MKNKITFKIFNEIDFDLEQKLEIIDKSSISHVFQQISFIKEYVKKNKLKFFFIAIYFEERLSILIPLEIKKIFGVKILQYIGSKEFDYCSPIISNLDNNIDAVKFNETWKNILKSINGYDLIFFDKQPEKIQGCDNPIVKYLKNTFLSRVYLIKLPSSNEEYIEKLSGQKFFNELQRTSRKLQQDNIVNFKILGNEDNLNIRSLMVNKANSLNKKNIKHILNEKFIDYFVELKKRNQEIFNLSVLEIDKEIIAANLGLVHQNTFYYYMPTIFSEKYKKYSPGKILIYNLIQWCIKNKIKIFDFGLGDEDYKKYWSNNKTNLFRHFDYRGFKGLVLLLFLKIYIFIKKLLIVFFSHEDSTLIFLVYKILELFLEPHLCLVYSIVQLLPFFLLVLIRHFHLSLEFSY